jgi:hypothetical protein
VIGKAAAEGMEEIVALFERVEEARQGGDVGVGDCAEAVHPGIPHCGVIDTQRLVGAIGGVDFGLEGGVLQLDVPGEVVGGIVGGAQRLDLEFLEDAPYAQGVGGKQGIGLVPNGLRGGFFEIVLDSEVAHEFEMGPVKEGIAERVGDGVGPGLEFFERGGVTCAIALGDAVGAHGPPLVMIALEPDLEQIGELAVFGEILGREMIVVVQNGLVLGVGVV